MSKKILIVAGGTGGHICPAVVLGHELQDEFGMDVFFAGTKKGPGKDIFTREGFNYELFDIEGLTKKFSFWKLLKTFFKSLFLFKRVKPDAVVGMGGYVTPPVVLAAVLSNIPTVIHEQNVVAGFANRFLNKLVDQTTVAFYETLRYFKDASVIGNPVRLSIELAEKEAGIHNLGLNPGKPTIFVLGGSQGSHNLNMVFKETVLLLEKDTVDFQFVMMTGENDWKEIDEFCRRVRFKSVVQPFFYNIEDAYSASDLIIARAGALTVSEICACGKPAIFVPYPYAAGNHQYYNAKRLEERGGAIIISEKELSSKRLVKDILDLLSNNWKLTRMGEINKRLHQKDAARHLALSVLGVTK